MPEKPEHSNAEMLTRYRRRQSRLYRWLRAPLPFIHNPTENLLPYCEGPKLWIGGAAGSVPEGFINVDMEPLPGVDVAADVGALPFRNESAAAIECDAVLEHVVDPVGAVGEMVRVLRSGGMIHIVVPFNQAFHAYPSDHYRWTLHGLRQLLESAQCEVLHVGVRTGPTATMLTFFCEYCRMLAPASMGKFAYAAANWLVWPLRYLDVWLNRKPNAHMMANAIYVLGRKKRNSEVAGNESAPHR
jgi:SAM-dependent methyltransferase